MNLESKQGQAPLELLQVMFASTVVFVVNFFGFLWFLWSVLLLSHSVILWTTHIIAGIARIFTCVLKSGDMSSLVEVDDTYLRFIGNFQNSAANT